MSVQSLINVWMLLMLIFFIFAPLGVFFFRDIEEGDIIDPKYKNFKTFGDSFLLLFTISTGGDWNRIMYDCWKVNSIAPFYFIVFVMLVNNIILNLFTLVIIEQFSKYYDTSENSLSAFRPNVEKI